MELQWLLSLTVKWQLLYWLTQDFSSIPIQREYKILLRKDDKKEKRINLILTIIISGIVFIYGVTSLLYTGIRGLRDLFWMSYIQWIILNFGDFFLLDILLFQGKYKNKIVIPGTEGNEDYKFGNWMKHLAIKEHFILMPFLLIPIISIIQAWLVFLLGL